MAGICFSFAVRSFGQFREVELIEEGAVYLSTWKFVKVIVVFLYFGRLESR